jgi:PEP-CTERM/exosortase A-associated glycosyltransferase
MRILHILDHSIPLHSGYVFRSLAILERQRAFGWATAHVTSPKHYLPTPPKETIEGWEFYRTPPVAGPLGRVPAIGETLLIRALARRIDEAVAEEHPDILHAHSPALDGLAALWVARRRRLPLVYEVRAFWEDAAVSNGTTTAGSLRYRVGRWLETYVLKRANAVTTICEGLREDIIGRGLDPSRVTVIPNAVDTAAFKGAAPPERQLVERYGLQGKVVLGFFGSFYHYEGLHLLLRALPQVAACAPDVRLLLAGGGQEEANLKMLAAELGIADKVIFAGRVPNKDIQKHYDLADLLVFPRVSMRLTELVTPLKPLEAMAQEKIVLASDVGGHRELIRDRETGYLFAPNDPEALAAAVLRVLADRDAWAAMRARGREFVEKQRNWDRSVRRYRAIYEGLLAERS